MNDHPLKKYFPAPDEMRDAWINDYDSGMPREAEYCQHGNCPDDGCDKCESAAQWFDEKALQEENAGGEDVCVPASSPVPLNQSREPVTDLPERAELRSRTLAESNKQGDPSCLGSPTLLQLDYPVWRLSFSEYGNQNGLELPEQDVNLSAYDEFEYWEQGEQE